MTRKLKSGNITPISGQYEKIGPRDARKGIEVTSVKGNRLPPSKKGDSFKLVDKTKHKKR